MRSFQFRTHHRTSRLPRLLLACALVCGLVVSQPGRASGPDNAGGVVAGQFSATPSGAAAFQVPIKIAPGIRGLHPNLSLVYNSQNIQNGTMGIGWALGGISAIHRCGQTFPVDGRRDGVTNTRADRLCLDGQRLVPRQSYSGNNEYWEANGYSKEIEDWSETTGSDSCGNSPCEFQTRAPNGQLTIYGGTEDSIVRTVGATGGEHQITQWLVSEVRDPNGNSIHFYYTNGGSHTAVIERIEYGGHSVRFVYDNRGNPRDQLRAYDRTGLTILSKRLRRIHVNTAEGEFKQYRLSYGGSALSGRSRLQKIDECSPADVCMDPIQIGWNDPGAPNANFRVTTPGGIWYQNDLKYDGGVNIIPGDFDGDGKTDFIRQEKGGWDNKPDAGTFKVYLSRGDGRSDIIQQKGVQFEDWLRYDPGAKIHPGDFNGDGMTDFIRQERGGWDNDEQNTFMVYFATGGGYFRTVTPSGRHYQHDLKLDHGAFLILGDYNGDGKTDFIRQEHGNWVHDYRETFRVYLSKGDGTFEVKKPGVQGRKHDPFQHHLIYNAGAIIVPGDYNGDGKTDFIRLEHGSWGKDIPGTFKVYFSKGDGDFQVVTPPGDHYQEDLRLNKGLRLTPADVNGDGKMDFLAQYKYLWNPPGDRTFFRVYLSKGDGSFEKKSNWRQGYKHNGWLKSDWGNLIPLDYNGDGKMDFIRQDTGEKANDEKDAIQVYVSRGDGFFDLKDPGGWAFEAGMRDNQRSGALIIPGDFDGDGREDFITQPRGRWGDSSRDAFRVVFSAPQAGQAPPETIASIQQGPVQHEFTYRRLSSYAVNHNQLFRSDHAGLASALSVIRSYTRTLPTLTSSGTAQQTITRTYDYRGATLDTGGIGRGGRGFLGFKQLDVLAAEEGNRSRTLFNVGFPYTGLIARTETRTADGSALLSETVHTWQSKPGAAPGSHVINTSKRVNRQHFQNGVQEVESTYHYDSVGNPILVTDFDGGRTLQTCSSFDNDLSAKRPGPLTGRIQSTSCSASGNSCSCTGALNETKLTHDAIGNVKQIRAYDDTRNGWLVVEYEYDAAGNRIRATKPGGAVAHITYDSTYNTYPVEIRTEASGRSFVETRAYDARFGQSRRQVDANGAVLERKFDDFGRIETVSRSAPGGSLQTVKSVSYAREADGLFSQTTSSAQRWDAVGTTVHKRTVDALGREVRKIDGSGAITSREHDARGQVRRESGVHKPGAIPEWTVYNYDARHNLSEVLHPGGARANVDLAMGGVCAGHQVQQTTTITGGTGRHTIRCVNPRGKTEMLRMIDPISKRTTEQNYTLDALDRLRITSDAQSTVSVELDSLGRQTLIDSTEHGVITYSYDARGHLRTESKNGKMKTFTYDALSREKRIDFHDGSYVEFEYDDASLANNQGRLSRALAFSRDNKETSRREFAYDPDGELAGMTLQIGNEVYPLAYKTDPQGRPEAVRYPGGREACYDYDDMGNLQNIRVGANGCDDPDAEVFAAYSNYSAAGQPGRAVYANNVSSDYKYDAFHRLRSATTEGLDEEDSQVTFLDQHYTWTALGEVDSIDDRAGDNDATYSYDGLGYLTRAVGAYGDISYEYSPGGNLVKKGDLALEYSGSRPTGSIDTGLVFEYDLHGNVVRREKGDGTVLQYQYNGRHLIEQVKRNGTLAGLFEYDASGQRVKKVDGFGIQTVYVSPELEVMHYPDGREFTTTYINGPAGRIGATTTETGEGVAAATLGQWAAATALLQAQMYNTATLGGLAGFLGYNISAMLHHPDTMYVARTALFSAAIAAVFMLFFTQLVRTARNRGLIGRLRSAWAWGLADAGLLSPATARSFAWSGDPASGFHRRRRLLSLPAPFVLTAVLALSMQCIGLDNSDDRQPLLIPPSSGNAAFAADPILGPGQNGYGYPEPGTYYFQQDQVGSTSLITNQAGRLVSTMIYKPFGELYQDASKGRDIFRSKFNGNEWDRDGDMYYFNARYYDPTIGTFLQADDLLFGTDGDHAAALNRYAFAGNNPVTYSDPGGQLFPLLGVFLVMAAKAITVAAGAAASAAAAAAPVIASAAVSMASFAASAAWAAATSTIGSLILSGAAIGAIMYSVEVGISGEKWDVGHFFAAAGIGALAGLVGGMVTTAFTGLSAGFTFSGLVVTKAGGSAAGLTLMANVTYGLGFVVGGMTASFITSSLGQYSKTGNVNWDRVGAEAGIGGALGLLGVGAAKLFKSGSSALATQFPEKARALSDLPNRTIGGFAMGSGFSAIGRFSQSAFKIGFKGSVFGSTGDVDDGN